MTSTTRTVKVTTTRVGTNFAVVGVIRDARTGRRLLVTDPRGSTEGARNAALAIAESKGWATR